MNKFDFYLHLRSLGIKEKHAIKMVKQTKADHRQEFENAVEAVSSFTVWEDTKEGHDYWAALDRWYVARGLE